MDEAADEEERATLTWDLLSSLLAKNLVVRREVQNEARFYMLETIRAYARERLLKMGTLDWSARRHAEHYRGVAAALGRKIYEGADVECWLDAAEMEHANFRAALQWCIANNEGELAAAIASGLHRFWKIRNHWPEGRT